MMLSILLIFRLSTMAEKLRVGDLAGLFDSPILGSVGVGLGKYRSIITSDLQTKPTLIARMK